MKIVNKENSPSIVFLLSAKDYHSLKSLADKYLKFLQQTNCELIDICYSLLIRSTFYKHKLIITCNSKEELCFLLKKFITSNDQIKTNNQIYLNESLPSKPKIAYVFSGQGGQWFAMGRHLIANEPIFANSIEVIDVLLQDIAGWSLIKELNKNKPDSLINKTEIAQLAIFAIQVSLVKLLDYSGIKPEGLVGHSLGETAAAYTAGVFNLKEAVYIVYHRGRIQAKQANLGKILAVHIEIEEAKKDIMSYGNRISIATINGPNIVTIAGDTKPLNQLAKIYTERGYFNRFVNVEVPYHSYHMDALKQELIDHLGNTIVKLAAIPLYSTVSAQQESGLHLTGDYWFKNVRYPVLFTDTIKVMIKDGFNLFIEIGPHPLLVEGMRSLFDIESYRGISFSLMNRKFEDEMNYYIQNLTRLIGNNVSVNINKILKGNGKYISHRVLPSIYKD